jgi:CRP-like cAMP-binding protein
MSENPRQERQSVSDLLVAKVAQHATMSEGDEAALRNLPFETKNVNPEEDIVSQGERPDRAVFVLWGMLGRYHTLPDGHRQYLSFHISADMPDVQSLSLAVMDHSLCAIDHAKIATFQHGLLIQLILKRPGLGFGLWRITLIDAAIFRQAITNNSARGPTERLAHFCCEQFFRAREAGINEGMVCDLPLNQTQLGQALGMSHISVNRALQKLRKAHLLELRGGKLNVQDWAALSQMAGFDPTYLYVDKESEMSLTAYKGRR